MNRRLIACLALGMLAPAAHAALPGDSVAGQRLHATSCTGCHDTSVYTRKNRTVASLDGLKEQLQACAHMAKKDFTPAEKQDLVRFLNDRFYHFN